VTVDDLETLFDYSYWANARLFASIAALTDEEFVRPVAGSWASVRSTLVHMMSAEGGWLERAGGPKRGAPLKPDDFPTLASVAGYWTTQEQKVRTFLAGLTDADLTRRLQFTIPQLALTGELPIGEMLHHAANHNTHHRGQVSVLVRALGRAPGDVDILFYYGDASRAVGQRA
jgi:uncharacterized damage-inducible protein DinB